MANVIYDYVHNEGGRGLVLCYKRAPFRLYVCFWTPWLAPRLYLDGKRLDLSFDP